MTTLGSTWKAIEDAGTLPAEKLRFLECGEKGVDGRPILAGLDARGERHLCIPTDKIEAGGSDHQSRGIGIDVRPLIGRDGSQELFVDIHCRRPDLNALFEIIADDILGELRVGRASAFAAAHAVLERWRDLLGPIAEDRRLLTSQQLAALLAELLFLEKLGPGAPPVSSWMGPEKGPHDFVCGSHDFEVKSTLSTTARRVHVNGLQQLSAAPGVGLWLWWVRLRPAVGRGFTVPETVLRLVARGANGPALFKKLEKEGYLPADAERYAERFEFVEDSLFDVLAEEFPRLTNASFIDELPTQIKQVDYMVDLDGIDSVSARTAARILTLGG